VGLGSGVLAGVGATVAGGGVETGVDVLLGSVLGELAGPALGEACGALVGASAGAGSRRVGGTIASTAGTASPIVPRAVCGIGEKFWVAVPYSGPGAPFGSAGVQRKTSSARIARLANDDAIRFLGEPLPHRQSPTKIRFNTVKTTTPRPRT
jgi:hypothetical protein